MTVNSFDPTQQQQPLDPAAVQTLLSVIHPLADNAGVADFEAGWADAYSGMITHPGWAALATDLGDDQIVSLVRFFTLAEGHFSGWQAGDKSAVVPLVRELKGRGTYPVALTGWIKANSDNKFLPHGSLMDRL